MAKDICTFLTCFRSEFEKIKELLTTFNISYSSSENNDFLVKVCKKDITNKIWQKLENISCSVFFYDL